MTNQPSSIKSNGVTVSELVDLAVPSENGKHGDRNALRTLLHLMAERLEVNSQTPILPAPELSMEVMEAGGVSPEFNVPDVLMDISKCLHKGMEEWVTRYRESTCRDLVRFLKMQGSTGIATYIENCMNDLESRSPAVVEPSPDTPLIPNQDEPSNSLDNFVIKFLKTPRYPFILLILAIAIFAFGLSLGLVIPLSFRNVSPALNPGIESSLTTSYQGSTFTTTQMSMMTSSSPTHCIPLEETSQNWKPDTKHHLRVMPNWSTDLVDFCGNRDTMLLLRTRNIEQLDALPEIRCPENVTAIELSGSIHFSGLIQFLSIFCRVRKLIFAGPDVCSVGDANMNMDTLVPLTSMTIPSVTHLLFENLNRCKTLYSNIASNLILTNLNKMSFKCVDFDTRDNSALSYLIDSNANVSMVECLNGNNCVTFNSKIPRGTKLKTGYVKC